MPQLWLATQNEGCYLVCNSFKATTKNLSIKVATEYGGQTSRHQCGSPHIAPSLAWPAMAGNQTASWLAFSYHTILFHCDTQFLLWSLSFSRHRVRVVEGLIRSNIVSFSLHNWSRLRSYYIWMNNPKIQHIVWDKKKLNGQQKKRSSSPR
jgi:hypothetical protein